ncbi:MAG: two-component regulator propeller domain-containing protein, partial [Bacteroidota bacterium]
DLLPVNLHPRLSRMQNFIVDNHNNLFGTQVLANEHRDDIIRVNLSDRSRFNYPVYDARTPLHLGKDGRVWFFSMNRGVYGFLNGNSVTNYCWPERSLDPKPITASIENTFEDKEGNIWLLTNNGLYVFNPYQKGISKIKELEGETGNIKISEVLSLYQSGNQQIWIGTYFKGTYLLDRNLRLKKRFYVNLPENYKEPSRTSLDNFNSIWVFHEDKSGNIWAGGQLGVLMKFSPEGKLLWKQAGQYFNYQTIRSMAEDINGNLWIGTHGGLLYTFNPADLSSELVLDRSIEAGGNYRLLQIIPENGERLWLVYKDQLICWDTKTNKPLRPVMQSNKNKLVELKDEVINGAIPWNKDSLFVYGFYPYWFDKSTQTYTKIAGFSKLTRDEIMFAFKHKDELWLDQKGLLVKWHVKNHK